MGEAKRAGAIAARYNVCMGAQGTERLLDRIATDPKVRGGSSVVRGTRITVGDVLWWLASGMTHAEILQDYPDLTEADIRACLAFAATREHPALLAS